LFLQDLNHHPVPPATLQIRAISIYIGASHPDLPSPQISERPSTPLFAYFAWFAVIPPPLELIPKKNFCVQAQRFNGEQTRSRKQIEFSTANHAEYANKDWLAPLALITVLQLKHGTLPHAGIGRARGPEPGEMRLSK
jgi:hypothetical protein